MNASKHTAVMASIREQQQWSEELYKHFHRTPELSMQEHETAARIEAEIRQMGLETQRIGGTGVVAVVENGEGPTVLARADIDGLPLTEAEAVDYRSENDGVMHGCGHDFHITALLGALRALAEQRESWSGTYIALFQPAEETAEGAAAMVDDDLVEKLPRPDIALGQHVLPGFAGQVQIGAGTMFSQADSLKVTIHGRGSHGSMPHLAVDPVVLASTCVVRLQSIVAREVPPDAFSVLTVGAINAGTKSNIIPNEATLLMNLRHYDPAVRRTVIAAIERIITAECEAAGTPQPPTFEYYDQFPLLVNDPEHTAVVRQAFEAEFDDVADMTPAAGSEDFPHLPAAWDIPGVYWVVGGTDRELCRKALEEGRVAELIPANHSPQFIPELQPTLEVMTRAQVTAALHYLGA